MQQNRCKLSILQTITQHNLLMRGVTVIVVATAFYLSFKGYAGFLSPDFDSDQAIHVLMAADLQLPADLYYWGQQRGGSIIPILGNFLLKNSKLSPIEAVSYIQYFILLIGYLAFASVFKTNIARLLFALVWFLPPHAFGFLLMLGHPYSTQLAFLGIAVVLIEKLPRKLGAAYILLRHLMITSAVICLFISFWASDFTLISMVLIGILGGLGILYRVWLAPTTLLSPKLFGILLLLALLVLEIGNILITSHYGIQFIRYAKEHAATFDQASLSKLNTLEQTKALFNIITHPIAQAAAFKSDRLQNILVFSIIVFWGCAATFLVVYSLFILTRIWLRRATTDHQLHLSPWIWIFLVNVVIGFIAIISSEWVYINSIQDGSGKRYFTPLYIMGWVAALLFTEGIPKLAAKPLWAILIVIALVGSATLPASVYGIEKFAPTVQRLQAVQQLGSAGIIGNHWTAYLLCSVNPKRLNCTQFDEYGQSPCPVSKAPPVHPASTRCPRCVERVLNSPSIYLVKNRWLETFPDEIEQFDTCLVRVGEPLDLVGYTFAPYRPQ